VPVVWRPIAFVAYGGAIAAAPPGTVKKIEVALEAGTGGACTGTIENRKQLKKSDNDFLTLRFSSECGSEQFVHVCAFEEHSGTPAQPWQQCAGLPLSQPAQLGVKFRMAAGSPAIPSTAHTVCTITFPAAASFPTQKFRLCVANAPASGPDPVCDLSARPDKRAELALEVDP
jgi:hypothetical protein